MGSQWEDKSKPHLNIVFVGHVDHGKSTTVGRLLLDSGHIEQHVIEKFEQEASERGKAGFGFAYVMDGLKEERERGLLLTSLTRNSSLQILLHSHRCTWSP